MGANVEWDIFLKKEGFLIGSVLTLAREMGLDVRIEEMSVFDDWEYTNERNIDPCSFDLETGSLFLERFTQMRFLINNFWHGAL